MTLPTVYPEWIDVDTNYGDINAIVPTTADEEYPDFFPGYVGEEARNSFTDAYLGGLPMADYQDAQGSRIDRTSYGEMGEVNRNAYSIFGPVEPNSVEDFQLYGEVSDYQRAPEWAEGPVGQYDHGAYTAAQIMQQMSPEAYTESTLVSLLTEGL